MAGDLATFLAEVRDRKLNLRIRMLGGSQAGYARLTRRWWAPVRATLTDQGLGDRPIYFVSSNPHSMVNLVTPTARRERGRDRRASSRQHGPDYLLEELERFREGRAEGSWENFLYYGARLFYEAQPEDGAGVGAPAQRRARARRHAPLLAHRPARVARR